MAIKTKKQYGDSDKQEKNQKPKKTNEQVVEEQEKSLLVSLKKMES